MNGIYTESARKSFACSLGNDADCSVDCRCRCHKIEMANFYRERIAAMKAERSYASDNQPVWAYVQQRAYEAKLAELESA